MPEYLIVLTSSEHPLLKSSCRMTSDNPDVVRARARQLLAERREYWLGGADWDTWSVYLSSRERWSPPLVARGTWESD